MDLRQHLMELQQRFQLNSFDGDISHLSGVSSSSNGSLSDSEEHERAGAGGAAALDVSASAASEFSSPGIGINYRRRGQAGGSDDVVSPVPSPAAPSASATSAALAAAASKRDRSQSRRDDDLRMRYEQLKKNVKKREEELEKTTREFDELKHASSRDRTELADRVRTLESRLMSAESATRSATLEFEHALKTKSAELASLSASLRASQAALADQNPDILKQIEFVKDDLSDLTTSEAMYLEYKAIEPHRQTIREYVCCNVYELVRAERSSKESMARELEMIRAKFIQAEQDAERNAREREQIGKQKKNRETELLSDLSHLETLNQKLHDDLAKKTMLVQELSSKGEMYDGLLAKANRMEIELSEARSKDMMQSITLKSLSEEKDVNASRLFNLEKSQDLLRQDKLYLSKEVDRLTAQLARSNQMLDRADSKNLELKKQKEDLVEKLVKVREDHARSYEEKLSAELNRLQSRTASDLESIRTNQREAFEREIAGLKESRDRIAADYEKEHTSLEGLKADYAALQDEHRRLQSQLESERADARNALKLKAFEYDRLSLTYEELLADLRKSKTDSEILAKKMSVLKSDHYALQAETSKRILELESESKNLQEKLQMYQQLEYELDVAILQAGGLEEGQSIDGVQPAQQGSAGQIRGIHSLLESLGSNVPTANKRRMKQSILLAQQLVQKSRQIEVLTQERAHFQSHNAALETELASLKQSLDNVNQPHHYLITNLQQKDAELGALTAQLGSLKSELHKREEELRQALLSKTALEADLHRLIAGRQHLEGIKSALMQAHQGGSSTASQGKAATLDQQWAALQKGIGSSSGGVKENRPPHSFAEQDRYASLNDPRAHLASMASSQGRPTSSFAAHNQQQPAPLSASVGGDSSLDAQPKPLWFRKLHH